MLQEQFYTHLEKDPPLPVYLFTGDGDFFKEEAWEGLLSRIVPEKGRRFNGERFLAKEITASEVIGRLNTVPMSGSRRLVFVQNIETWPKEQIKVMESYLARPSPVSCLVLSCSQKKGLEKIYGAVSNVGTVVEFKQLRDRDALRWVQDRAKRSGKTMTSQAAMLLVETVGLNPYLLEKEVEKLVTYVGDRAQIGPEAVTDVTSCQKTFSVFEMLRYVAQRNSRQAIASLRNLLLMGDPPLAVLALLSRQVRIMWQVKDALDRKMSLSAIAQRLKLPQAVLANYAQQANLFSEEDFLQIHAQLRDTDIRIKSTSAPPELLLEALVMRLCWKR